MSSTSDAESSQYIAFQLGSNTLLSSLVSIDEIVDVMPLNPVPGTEPWFLGLGAQKGQLLPVSDLGRYVGGTASTTSPNCRLLIVSCGRERVGLAVDDVLGLVDAGEQSVGHAVDGVDALPPLLQSVTIDQLVVDGKNASLLNLPALLDQPKFLSIADAPLEVPA